MESFKLLHKFKISLFYFMCSAFLIFVMSFASQAQTGQTQKKEITGVVTDSQNNQPIPGVNVIIKGTSIGTVTDVDGKYKIMAYPDDYLVFSYIGYVSQEVHVGDKTVINIGLVPGSKQIGEVVVVGYGVQKRSHVTGSVAKLKNNEYLSQMPVARAGDVLKGQLAGVLVQNTNAEAGAAPKITIRGITSVNSSNNPLIVVDGYPIPGDLSTIDMHDVQSIEVLKDAASASIYGSRGANGVILVTTKSGKAGKTTFRFNAFAGTKSVYKKPGYYPTPSEWTNFVNSSASSPDLIPDQIGAMNLLGTATNYEDIVFKNGVIQNYNLGASGGNDKVQFYISGGYLDDDGVIITNNYKRYNLNVKVDAKINKWLETGITVIPSFSKQRVIALGLQDALRNQPWLPEYHTAETVIYAHAAGYDDVQVGDWAHERHFTNVDGVSLKVSSNNNAIAKVEGKYKYYNNYQVNANSYLKFNIVKGLSFRSTFGTFVSYYESQFYQAAWSHRKNINYGTYGGNLTTDFLNENTLNYTNTFGNNFLNLLAGFTYQSTQHLLSNIRTSDFLTDKIHTLNAGTIIDKGSTYKTKSNLVSTLFRANYAYKNKYMISATVRWDGSSRFGENNKWGFFPSVSAGWNIANEEFMKNQEVVNTFKLRVSYGTTGNNRVGDYAAQALVEPIANAVIGDGVAQGFTETNIANPNLSWEQTNEFDAGIDLGFLGDRFDISIDYYNKKTKKLLLFKEIPSVTGFTNVWTNMGKVQNQGFEIEFFGHIIDHQKFKWNMGLNFAHNKNKLLDFGGPEEVITTPDRKRPSQFIARVGDPLVQFYGYVVDYEINREDMTSPYWPVNVTAANVYVKDMNGDGVITPDDRVPLGKPYPDFTWGFTNTFYIGNVDIYMLWQGAQGASVYNIDSYYFHTHWKGGNKSDIENAEFLQSKVVTGWNVQDASYTSLRNLTIGYSFPARWFENNSVGGIRLYFTTQNLLYFTSSEYTGMNPEGVNRYNTTLTYGYQRGAAPISRSFVFGLDLNF